MKLITLLAAVSLIFCAFAFSGCDILSKATSGIQGNIAGDVVDQNGNPEAYRSIFLVSAEDRTRVIQTQTTDENGHFFFGKIDSKEYYVVIHGPNDEEYGQIDEKSYNLTAGRTLNITVKIDRKQVKESSIKMGSA